MVNIDGTNEMGSILGTLAHGNTIRYSLIYGGSAQAGVPKMEPIDHLNFFNRNQSKDPCHIVYQPLESFPPSSQTMSWLLQYKDTIVG